MSAYWICTYVEIKDQAKVSAYAELAKPAVEAAGGTFVARGTPARTFESGQDTRTVVVRFDSVDQAVAAYSTPAYEEALAALDDGAVRDLRIVPGVD